MASKWMPETALLRQVRNASLHRFKVLAVIDGSERTGRVVQCTLNLARHGVPLEVVLLGTVEEPAVGRLRGYGSFKRDVIEADLKAMRRRAVTAAARHLAKVEIPIKERVEIGNPVETILVAAAEEGSDIILVADSPAGAVQRCLTKVTGLWAPSLPCRVVQSSEIPVVVVK
jgi:nucleotide-binding universal stress UspA family protein